MTLFLAAAIVVAAIVGAALPAHTTYAAQITARSLTLQAGATDGGSKPGGVVNHFFQFTLPAAGNPSVGSILFKYCTTATGATCTRPTGLVTNTGATTLGSQNGATGFTLVNTNGSGPGSNGQPYLTRAAASVTGPQAVSYQLLGVTNPDGTDCATVNCTFYVRISTYASTDTTGAAIDTGTVAASTAEPIVLNGIMPESLVFCTGATVGTTSGVPDCASSTPGSVNFDRLFSPIDTATATSQMAASTNAGSGYIISVNGVTLTSGSNTITANGSALAGVRGTGQFGLNLKANTITTSSPAQGAEVAPAANGTNYRGEASAGYSTVDQFKFVTGDTVADSYNGGAGGTDAQIFTATYIVNVSGSQPAGTYTTTLTYICTPTF